MSRQEFPHMSICGALHLSEGPPFGVPSEVYITDIPSHKTLLTHRSDHCPVLPPMPFKFPTSFHEQQSLLPASGRMLLGGGKITNGCPILIQTTMLDRCISHENYPNGNGYGKPTSHAIQSHSSTASHGHRTCTRSCLFGLGGGLPQNLFWKRKGEISSSRRVSI